MNKLKESIKRKIRDYYWDDLLLEWETMDFRKKNAAKKDRRIEKKMKIIEFFLGDDYLNEE